LTESGAKLKKLKVDQLMVKMHKFKIKDQSEKSGQLHGWHLNLTGIQLN
jgi:hypothetical protein